MFCLHVFILNASEELPTRRTFPLQEGPRRYLGAVADDVGVAAAEAETLVAMGLCLVLPDT